MKSQAGKVLHGDHPGDRDETIPHLRGFFCLHHEDGDDDHNDGGPVGRVGREGLVVPLGQAFIYQKA